MRYKVLVIWSDGEEEFVAGLDGSDAIFTSQLAAQEIADGFMAGIDVDDVQSVSVVKA